MTFSDILPEGGVLADLKATSKKQMIQELARAAAAATGFESREIFEAVLERERLGSTGVGGGVAIPHARLAGLAQVTGVFARLETPIDVDAIDEQPADLIFMLLAPDEAGVDHLKALARVSRAFRREDFREQLRSAANADALRALLAANPPGEGPSDNGGDAARSPPVSAR